MNQSMRITLSYVSMLILSILPLPIFLSEFRPPWILLLSLYLQLFAPAEFRIYYLFFTGLILDVLLSTVIGEHGFALILVLWLSSYKTRRFFFYSILQQMMLIGFFCPIYQLVISLTDHMVGNQWTVSSIFSASLMGLLFWPWIKLFGSHRLVYLR